METILQIAKDYYLVFTVISVVLILALVGYVVDKNVGKDIKIKKKKADKVNIAVEETIDSI